MEPLYTKESTFKRWGGTLTVDFACGAAAGVVVTPIVLLLDTAITEAAFRKRTITQSFSNTITTFFSSPARVVLTRPCGALLLLYSVTYATANIMDTFATSNASAFAAPDDVASKLDTPPPETSSGLKKFFAVSTVNMLLSLNKDTQFAKALGSSSAPRKLPVVCYLPFVMRDGITLFASFNVPPLLAPHLPEACEGGIGRLAVAQLVSPAASQIIATPLHLLALDLYNRNAKLSFRERMQPIKTNWIPVSFTRMMRIVPGLAFGNVLNTKMRSSWRDSLN